MCRGWLCAWRLRGVALISMPEAVIVSAIPVPFAGIARLILAAVTRAATIGNAVARPGRNSVLAWRTYIACVLSATTISSASGIAIGPTIISTSVTAGIATSVSAGIATGISTGIAASITAGIATSVSAGVTTALITIIAIVSVIAVIAIVSVALTIIATLTTGTRKSLISRGAGREQHGRDND